MIRLWKDRQLASDFAGRKVTEKEKFGYFLLFQVGIIVSTELLPSEPNESALGDWISAAVSLLITMGGYFVCFRSNKDNEEFIARCICLSIPIMIKTTAYYVVPLCALFFSMYFALGEADADRILYSEPLLIGTSSAYLVLYMWRLNSGIKLIQKLSATQEAKR